MSSKKMVIIDPKDTIVFECGVFGIYPKHEGYSILDTRFFKDGFGAYRFVRRDASFLEKLRILFAKY